MRENDVGEDGEGEGERERAGGGRGMQDVERGN